MNFLRTMAFLLAAALALPALVGAQCSTDDLDMDGVPDVCPPGSNYIEGTEGGDFLFGTNQDDCIFALGGNDIILGRGGDDFICSGDGNDAVLSGSGADTVFGEGGNDFVNGGSGGDFIDGGDGNDNLGGSSGNDTINGGAGNDTISGGNGNDTLSGQDGDDTINGGNGSDALSGGDGNDALDGGGGTDSCVEEVPGSSTGLTNCATTTYAAVSRFDLLRADDGLVVAWETTSEVGTVAFRVWRRDPGGVLNWVGEVLAAAEGSPHGARYVLRDAGAPSQGPIEYLLEERTVSGGSVQYGPYIRSAELPRAGDTLLRRRAQQSRAPRPVELQRISPVGRAATLQSRRRKNEGAPIGAEILVAESGVVEVSADALSEALHASSDAIAHLIRSGGLHLKLRGASIAWQSVAEGTALRFIAPELRSPFSAYHRYLLLIEDGLTMEALTLLPKLAEGPHRFLDTKRFEENVFPGPSGGPDPRMDLFFWHALSSDAQVSIPVSLPALAEASAEEIRVYVHAATEHPEQPHRVELHWNGQSLGAVDLVGRERHTITVPLAGFASSFENELIVQQHVAGEAPPVLYVDSVEVDYDRFAEADAPVFHFGGDQSGLHSVSALLPGATQLFDVTDPREPKSYGEVMIEESGLLSFVASGADRRFVAAQPGSITAPIEVSAHNARDLRSTELLADYVIIAASHLLADAQALADLREADGYRVLLVDVDDVFWNFADGEPDPLAIREFLAFAREHWETGPAFAALIGKGSLDYRDLLGLGGNWVPAALVPTDGGLFPSDSILGDVAGDDGVPEIAIGRFPVSSGEELDRILDRIRTFEASHESMDVLFAADDSEHDEFAAAARALAIWTAPGRVQEIDLNSETLEDSRARLFAAWQSPLSWLSYVGHGGLDRLADEGLLTSADVTALAETQSSPVFLGWSCNLLRFDIPGFFSIGEQLITQGASAGVFSATGWSNHLDTDALRTAFTEAAFASDVETLGESMLVAHQAASSAPTALHRVYMLLGDPALRLRDAKAQPIPPPDPGTDPAPSDGSVDPSALPRETPDSPATGSGCEIGPSNSGSGPMGVAFGVLGLVLLIRRRRA